MAAIFHNDVETASEIYVDGAAQTLSCSSSPCTHSRTIANPLRLGASDVYAFHGMLDEVRLYDRALDAAEIALLAAGGACRQ